MNDGKTRKLAGGTNGQTKPLNGGTTPLRNDLANSVGRFSLTENIVVNGANGSYELDCTRLLGVGGEGVVYYGRNLDDGSEVAVKVMDNFVVTNGPTRDKVIDFLRSSSRNPELHLMPLVDEGIVEVEGYRQSRISYPFDVMPYVPGGPLEKLSYSELKKKLIPQILEAINAFHSHRLVHRDIKPENIYQYNGSYVLSDFSTVSEIINGGDFHGTSSRRGTKGYSAPEVWQGYVAFPADYYAFGCTIATLYNGSHVYADLLANDRDEGSLNNAINTNGMPLKCSPGEADIQTLVDTLVSMRDTDRPDYEGVKLWLADSRAFAAKYGLNRKQVRNIPAIDFAYRFEGHDYSDVKSLVKAFAMSWEKAKPHLYSGGAKGSTLIRQMSSYDQDIAVKLVNIVEDRKTATSYDLGLAIALSIMDPDSPIYWMGHEFTELSAVGKAVSDNGEEILKMLQSSFLSYKLKGRLEDSDLSHIEKVEQISRAYPKIAVKAFPIMVTADSNKKYKGYGTIREIAYEIFDPKKNSSIRNYMDDSDLLAFMVAKSLEDAVINYLDNRQTGDGEYWFYRLFENVLDDPTIVRMHYRQYGPYGDLNWLLNNLNLYKFKTSRAQTLRNTFSTYHLSDADSIENMNKIFISLAERVKDLQDLFTVDFGEMALFGDSDTLRTSEITSTQSDAFFLKEWNGRRTTYGFIRFASGGK